MHVLLYAEDSESELLAEVKQGFPGAQVRATASFLEAEFPVLANSDTRLPYLAFARQWLPNAQPVQAQSIRDWSEAVVATVAGVLPDNEPWQLQVSPHYGGRSRHRIGARAWHTVTHAQGGDEGPVDQSHSPGPDAEAGRHRSVLVRQAVIELLKRKRRHLLRCLEKEPVSFTPNASLVQVLLTDPGAGFISVAPAPLPFRHRHLLSPFPKGEVPVASDKAAPARAFAKLVEAETRLGRTIREGEKCVDLGASPGSWTYVAANRGARVLAIDRSPLREDLMHRRNIRFEPGDAFKIQPDALVDWLLCDVIAAPERSAGLLLNWLKNGWCRQFVVTIKLKDSPGADALALLKRELPPLTQELFLLRLNANKKEICAFGVAADRLGSTGPRGR